MGMYHLDPADHEKAMAMWKAQQQADLEKRLLAENKQHSADYASIEDAEIVPNDGEGNE